jgi:hypothetical protein
MKKYITHLCVVAVTATVLLSCRKSVDENIVTNEVGELVLIKEVVKTSGENSYTITSYIKETENNIRIKTLISGDGIQYDSLVLLVSRNSANQIVEINSAMFLTLYSHYYTRIKIIRNEDGSLQKMIESDSVVYDNGQAQVKKTEGIFTNTVENGRKVITFFIPGFNDREGTYKFVANYNGNIIYSLKEYNQGYDSSNNFVTFVDEKLYNYYGDIISLNSLNQGGRLINYKREAKPAPGLQKFIKKLCGDLYGFPEMYFIPIPHNISNTPEKEMIETLDFAANTQSSNRLSNNFFNNNGDLIKTETKWFGVYNNEIKSTDYITTFYEYK